MDNFAVFILSHGRPDHIKTLKALQKGHYTGKTYIVIDNEDDTAGENGMGIRSSSSTNWRYPRRLTPPIILTTAAQWSMREMPALISRRSWV